MRRNQQHFLRLGISILAALTLSPVLLAQTSSNSEAAAGVPTDWSHHHLIFSRPATEEQARRVQRDARYWQQLERQSLRTPAVESDGPASGFDSGSDASLSALNRILAGDWSEDMGSGATVGAGNYPAKYSFNLSRASCATDFAVYSTGLVGSGAQASIVAYNNLYSSCTGTVPSVYWAYNTGGRVLTSPVFSRDGTQVAFVHQNGSGHGILVLVKWVASATESITSPLTLTQVSHASYPTCSAPCKTGFPFDDAGTLEPDSQSSVFYDFSNDTAYVGDDAGWLHKFSPVFNGVPAEVGTGGWPVQVNAGSLTPALTSPVHDYTSGNVFVADKGGFLYLVTPSAGVTQSVQLDFSTLNDGGPGIVQGPVVDSTAGLVYVFAPSDGNAGCSSGADCSAVFQLPTTFTAATIPPEAEVGASTVAPAAPSPLYIGALDSTYQNSVNATGNLYVCGNTGGPPTFYQVSIVAGAMNAVGALGPVLSNVSTPCSPVTDVMNPNASGGATEWIFASAQNGGVSSACSSGGCIFNFKDTPWLPSTAYTVGQEVLDNHLQIQVVSVAGTSGATAPGWSNLVGKTTTDGTVTWLNQGPASAFTPPTWTAGHHTKGYEILDPAGNIELVTSKGTDLSGGTIPSFNAVAGGTTPDGTITWTNVGAIATAAMPAAGGTSGMIIDNTVGSGTLAGASQIYFSTLSDQICGSAVTPGGCAVQASQAGLK